MKTTNRAIALACDQADEVCELTPPSNTEVPGWRPIETAPDGIRVLLGPRTSPVVGIVRHMPEWAEEQSSIAHVTHYNGNVLVADYHCREWHPLPAAPNALSQTSKEKQ